MIWAMKSLDKLVMSPIDSKYGISLVTESPYGTTLLNVSRPAVLRQYYGTNVGTKKDGKIKIRATYGLSVLKNSVGTDPLKCVTKPFNKYLYRMSLYVTHIIRQLPDEYGYSKMSLSNPFNHCVKLIYISKNKIKEESSLGYHCDIVYNNDGCYMINQNEQIENTPTVIFTFGDKRILKWRRIFFNKR